MTQAGNKRKLQKEATREQIISTARQVYLRQGFGAPTMTIAQETGVAHGTIFVHFPRREDLQLEILTRFADEIGGKLHGLSISDCSLEDLLYAHIGVLEEYEAFYRNLLLKLPTLPGETRMLLASLHSLMSLHFGAVIEREQAAGKVKDVPLHMLFNTWIGLLHYYLQNGELFAPGVSVLKRRKKELVDAYVALTQN